MNKLNKLSVLIPFAFLLGLLTLLGKELHSSGYTPPPGMIGEKLPRFSLPLLGESSGTLNRGTLSGKVSLLNVWASWCSSCRSEHELLMKIKNKYGIPIYGILYRDNHGKAMKYLLSEGDPYQLVGADDRGDMAVNLGIYGTPETFVVGKDGTILYRQTGALTEYNWKKIIYPIIKQYR